MTELRHSTTTNEWVIIATDRAKRPEDFIGTLPNTPGWRVWVTPNAFTA